MIRIAALVAILCGACGNGDSGEAIGGTVTITVGTESVAPDVGAVIPDPDPANTSKAIVILGTRDISCATELDTRLGKGVYLSFTIDRAPATQMGFVSVIRVEAAGAHLNGSTGDIVIDAVTDRVTGSVMFDTVDADGTAISAEGTFDAIRCF